MTETIFKDMNAFEQGYVPKDFIHREGELKEIAFCLEPAFKGYQATSMKIHGEPATGKTTAVKIVFDEVKEKSSVACAYVNSSIYDTKFSIFEKIQRSLGLSRNANRLDAVYCEIFNKLSRNEKSLIVALDDVNFLDAQTLNEVLLRILKANEEFEVSASVIAISSSPAFSLHLRPQVASVFSPREIFFRPYTLDEMYDVLKQRCWYGFIPEAASDGIIRKIAAEAHKKKDLRLGIRLLKESGVIAERES
ncbi:MAG: AAA family ATPase, partial [Methanobacteriota archaeon]